MLFFHPNYMRWTKGIVANWQILANIDLSMSFQTGQINFHIIFHRLFFKLPALGLPFPNGKRRWRFMPIRWDQGAFHP